MLPFSKISAIVMILAVVISLSIVSPLQVLHEVENEKFEEDERSDESLIKEIPHVTNSVEALSDRTLEDLNTTDSNKVNLTIYYESECRFATKFFNEQLLPNYENFSPYLNLDLVPSGDAEYKKKNDGTYKFTCQHGPLECKENKLQGCAIDKLSKLSPSLVDKFIICYQSMRKKNPKDCAEKYSIDLESIQSCATSKEGDELFVKFTDRTNNYRPEIPSTPFVMVNDVLDMGVNKEFKTDLAKAVCKRLNNKPEVCGSPSLTKPFSTEEPQEEQ